MNMNSVKMIHMVALAGLVGAVFADEGAAWNGTNYWASTATGGLDFFDTNNWQNSTLEQLKTYSVFDMSAMPSGSWLEFGGGDAKARAVIFDGRPGDVWAYLWKDVAQTQKLAFDDSDNSAGGFYDFDLVVNGGLFKFSSNFHVKQEAVLHKRGDGDIWVNGQMRQFQHNQACLPTLCVDEGTAFASRDGLREADLRLAGGTFAITNSLSSVVQLGRYVSDGNGTDAIRLNGGSLMSGFSSGCVFTDEFASNSSGRLIAVGAQTTLLAAPPPKGVSLAALDGTLAVQAGNRPAPLGLWRFEDAANPGANDGTWSGALQANGAGCAVVSDPERGSVLRVANGGFLSGALSDIQPNQSYTIAVWIRPDPATDQRGTFVSIGTSPVDRNLIALRLNLVNGQNVYCVHWGGSNDFTESQIEETLGASLNTGRRWHHMLATHEGTRFRVYIDGRSCMDLDTKSPLRMDARPTLYIGRHPDDGSGTYVRPFTGWLDDVLVMDRAVDEAEAMEIFHGGVASSVTLDPATRLEVVGNGSIVLPGEQTVAQLGGDSPNGTLRTDGVLTVADAGVKQTFVAPFSGTGMVVKAGSGTLTLTAPSTHTGGTRVDAGTLDLDAPGSCWRFTFDDAGNLGASSRRSSLTFSNVGVVAANDPERGAVASFDGNAWLTANMPYDFPVGDSGHAVSCWIKPANVAFNNGTFVCWGNTRSQGKYMQFRFINSFSQFCLGYWGVDHTPTIGQSLVADGKWHHVAMSRSGPEGRYRVWVDGKSILDATNTAVFAFPAGETVFVGARSNNGVKSGETYNGLMDDLRIYARPLTEAEVAKLARNEEPTAADAIPAPVAHYGFEDAANPGRDSSTNGYDLVAKGSYQLVDSPIGGKMLQLSRAQGSQPGWFQYGDNTSFPAKIPVTGQPLTISCWVRPSSAVPSNATICYWGDITTTHIWVLDMLLEAPYGYLRFAARHGDVDYNGRAYAYRSLSRGSDEQRWHHVAATYSPKSGMTLYLDGIQQTGNNLPAGTSPVIAAQDFTLGSRMNNTTLCFDGCLDEFRIFDTALSKEQVQMLMRRDGAPGASALSEGSDLVVADGAEVRVGVDQTVGALTGAGTVRLQDAALTLAESCAFGGAFAGSGTLRLMPDVRIELACGLGAFPRAQLEAVQADDGKERRVYLTPGPNGSCVLENLRVRNGSIFFIR